LTFGTGLAFGKSNNITSSLRVQNGFRVSRSFNENLLLRGAAARFSISQKTEINLFTSNQKIDARISDQQTFESLLVTGLYRNPNELSNKNTLKSSIYGLNINTQFKSSKLGFTAVHSSFNKPPANSELKPYELLSNNQGNNINIGDGANFDWYPFWGSIHVARIYNRVLSVNEISQNYQTYRSRFNF
jgi:hypothetical protein